MNSERASITELPRTAISSVPDLAYGYLHEEITSGRLNEGAVVHQEDVATRLGASRVPVREALKRLESEGLVVQRPRRGYVVASHDPEAIEDIFDIRAILEERAVFLATLKRTEEDVRQVEALHQGMNAVGPEDPDGGVAFRRLHQAFHERLMAVCGREHLMRAITVQRDLVERYIRLGGAIAPEPDAVRQEHRRILEAFRDGNARSAGRESRAHAEHTGRRLLRALASRRPVSEG